MWIEHKWQEKITNFCSFGVSLTFLRRYFGVTSAFLLGYFGFTLALLRLYFSIPTALLQHSYCVTWSFLRHYFDVTLAFLTPYLWRYFGITSAFLRPFDNLGMMYGFGKVLNMVHVSSVTALAHVKASNYKQNKIHTYYMNSPSNFLS